MPDQDGDLPPLDDRPLVLVVDHDPNSRSTVTRMVRTLGFQARSCTSGAETLRCLQESGARVRLVLADLGMPRMDGGELAERIHDIHPTLHVALMARRDDPHVGDRLAGYGDFPFLGRPVVLRELADLLYTLLGDPGQVTPTFPSMVRIRVNRRSSGQHQYRDASGARIQDR
jgi:CheY-like chemotaxis protein